MPKAKPIQLEIGMIDEEGNKLLKWSNGLITLRLVAEYGRERNLGIIKGKIFHTIRKNNHLHYKTNSYGFNYNLLKRSQFQYVLMTTENKIKYKIPKEVILKEGTVMFFKYAQAGDSFEVQIFLPMSIIEKYEVKPKK
jgi:hypothetical protein